MPHAVDLTHPVYWLLIAGALGAGLVLILGLISIISFNRTHPTRELQRRARAASAAGIFGPLECLIFAIFAMTVLLLVAYLVIGLLLGLALI